MFNQNKTLGRGLSALLGDTDLEIQKQQTTEIDISIIKPGRLQPRQVFSPEKMSSLVESVREKGVIQPLILRKLNSIHEEYEIIAGERRWRAAKEVGLESVPAVVMSCTDSEALEIGLIENLQRDDLNPVEEAESFQRLIADHGKTQEQIAQALSKSRSYVANMLRLNTLPTHVKKLIHDGRLSAGHARALINHENLDDVIDDILKNNLSVRDTEQKVKQSKQKKSGVSEKYNEDALQLAEQISGLLSVKAKVEIKPSGGIISLYFNNYEQMDDLINKFKSLRDDE